jgi:hypothetical protein
MLTTADRAVRFGVADGSHSRVNFDSPYPETELYE